MVPVEQQRKSLTKESAPACTPKHGEAAFTAAWANGWALPQERAVVEALQDAPAD